MGFIAGKRVTVVQNAPLKDPVYYRIMDYNVSLRRQDAALIDVEVVEAVDEQATEGEPLLDASVNESQDNLPDSFFRPLQLSTQKTASGSRGKSQLRQDLTFQPCQWSP